eukprot:gene14051-17782_t
MVLGLLPFAGLARLAIGIWMFGNQDVIPSGVAQIGFLPGYSSADPAKAAQLYSNYLQAHKGDRSLYYLA